MKIKRFEDLVAWQKAHRLTLDVYTNFGKSKDFVFRDQICKAAISVPNNIAEGFDRSTDKDFARFLYISIGSCSEVRSMLYLAADMNYIEKNKKEILISNTEEVSRIIRGLIKSINST
jgi:four helix bundle protein